jgi:selenide,water dikinase
LIQTVDFFTPVVDDPYDFGQIAAANALSDVYAMGGIPKTAMNLVAFPIKDMDIAILRSIISGGMDKIREAGAVVLGGHSIEDKELKYGLSITGFVHPDHVLTKANIRKGDHLVLTKPLGTGIINTAVKGGMASAACIQSVTALMSTLNRDAARIMGRYPVHACTDITGFGLIGHLAEMIALSRFSAVVFARAIPMIPEALEFAKMGLVPAGTYKNREFREALMQWTDPADPILSDLLFDPQTSGGLLISVAPEASHELVLELLENKVPCAAVIGEVVDPPVGKIRIEQ